MTTSKKNISIQELANDNNLDVYEEYPIERMVKIIGRLLESLGSEIESSDLFNQP
jgi:hypothetical protein